MIQKMYWNWELNGWCFGSLNVIFVSFLGYVFHLQTASEVWGEIKRTF